MANFLVIFECKIRHPKFNFEQTFNKNIGCPSHVLPIAIEKSQAKLKQDVIELIKKHVNNEPLENFNINWSIRQIVTLDSADDNPY